MAGAYKCSILRPTNVVFYVNLSKDFYRYLQDPLRFFDVHVYAHVKLLFRLRLKRSVWPKTVICLFSFHSYIRNIKKIIYSLDFRVSFCFAVIIVKRNRFENVITEQKNGEARSQFVYCLKLFKSFSFFTAILLTMVVASCSYVTVGW